MALPQPALRSQLAPRVESETGYGQTTGKIKADMGGRDRAALLGVLQDLYASDEANRAFLHARFGLGDDPLQPYKKTIDRCLWPNVFRGQQTSVSRATGAITKYKKALGDPVGLAELLVFYCERAAGFCQEVHHEDMAYFDALMRMFEQALKATANLTDKVQNGFLARLDRVRTIGRQLSNGVGEDMDVLLSEFMTQDEKSGWRGPVLRVGAAMQAMLFAVVVALIVWRFNPTLRSGALFLIFAIFSVAFYFLWIWVFVERPAELAKKLPISGTELRRKGKNFTIA